VGIPTSVPQRGIALTPLPVESPRPASADQKPRQRLLGGVARVFAAEMLIIPTGIITVAFLTRRLGPSGYGMLAIAGAFVDWLEWGVVASFTRATVKFVSEAKDWRPVASRSIQLSFLAGLMAGAALFLLAGPIAALMQEPALARYLRLYSIDIPVFCLAQAHRDVLVGLGYFRERAWASACRWVARLALIVLLVTLGLSIEGAIIGGIVSSLIELAICRWFARPRLFGRSGFPARRLLEYVAPLSLYSIGVKLFDKLDLVTFKALGGTLAMAGIYNSAEGSATLPTILAASFAPLILSSLGEAMKGGDLATARDRGRRALRAMLLLVPLGGILPGMSTELVGALYGTAFLPAAPLFDVMIFGSIAMFIIAITTSIMVSAGKPGWTFRVMGPMVVLQLIGGLLVIPRMGAMGAALVTSGCAIAGAVTCLILVHRLWDILPPGPTLVRSVLLGVMAYFAAPLWPTPNALAFLKFFLFSVIVGLVFWWFGDLPGSRPRGKGGPAHA
jgi:O-antigen/teichoic acid export membrane protein